jgi:hypothetical protein
LLAKTCWSPGWLFKLAIRRAEGMTNDELMKIGYPFGGGIYQFRVNSKVALHLDTFFPNSIS